MTVVPPVILIPISGLAALAEGVRKSPTRLLEIFIVVPDETKIPFTVDETLLPNMSQIVFLKTFVVEPPPVIESAITADAPVDERVLIELLFTLVVVPILAHVIPVTELPVPVDVMLLIMLLAQVSKVEVPLPPKLIHVIEPPLVV